MSKSKKNRRDEESADAPIERVTQRAERLDEEAFDEEEAAGGPGPDEFVIDPSLVEAAERSELVLRTTFEKASGATRLAGRTLASGLHMASGFIGTESEDEAEGVTSRRARIRAGLGRALEQGASLVQPADHEEGGDLLLERLVRSRPGTTLTVAAGLGLAAGFAIRRALFKPPFSIPRRGR